MTPRSQADSGRRGTCPHCGDHANHCGVAVAQAHCAYRSATTLAVRKRAESLGVDPVAAADLLAHLRAPLSESDAYCTALYVLDLGWRPVVGTGVTA